MGATRAHRPGPAPGSGGEPAPHALLPRLDRRAADGSDRADRPWAGTAAGGDDVRGRAGREASTPPGLLRTRRGLPGRRGGAARATGGPGCRRPLRAREAAVLASSDGRESEDEAWQPPPAGGEAAAGEPAG